MLVIKDENAAGQKLKKTVVYSDSIKIVDYLDGFQYAGGELNFFPHPEGYVSVKRGGRTAPDGSQGYVFNYVFNYTDHLDERNQSIALIEVCERSSVRVSYSKDPRTNQLKILEENHYYPFGLKHSVYAAGRLKDFEVDSSNPEGEHVFLTPVTKTEYQYKYNSFEYQDELGLNWYDYMARNYDPALGRWMNVDPLAEVSRRWSAYTYGFNNPIIYVDPDGMEVINGDQVKMEEAQAEFDQISEDFSGKYASTNLKNKDFSNKDEFKQYKSDRSELKQAEKSLKRAESNFQNTENAINYFKAVDPKGFEQMDNLTYKNKAGEENTLDIIVTTGDASNYGGAMNSFAVISTTGNIRNNEINVTISRGYSMGSDKLAHEFGHGFAIARDPITYKEASKNASHSCQDPKYRNHHITVDAMDWQDRYNSLFKLYKKEN